MIASQVTVVPGEPGTTANNSILRRDNNDVVWTRVTEYRYDGPKQK